MILTAFDFDAFSSIFGIAVGVINLVFVVAFAIIEGRRISKIEKHHDIANWYETFKLHGDTYEFIKAADSFKQSMIGLINSKQKIDANKAVVIKDTFVQNSYEFKDKFLNVVEVIDKSRVREFTDNLNEIEDNAIELLNNVINLKSKEDRIAAVNNIVSSIKKKIIEIGFKLSVF